MLNGAEDGIIETKAQTQMYCKLFVIFKYCAFV